MQQQSVNGGHSISRQVGRLEVFGEEAETGCQLPEFVVILDTELKASSCLPETAGNQSADGEPRLKGIQDQCAAQRKDD